jgi:uncharacterized membrane protein HdeD (DUF308 family)
MPLGPQPRGARGTVERPYSALRLRLVLAIFGVVVCVAGAILLWHRAQALAIALSVLAAIALVDLGVVSTRLSRQPRLPPE